MSRKGSGRTPGALQVKDERRTRCRRRGREGARREPGGGLRDRVPFFASAMPVRAWIATATITLIPTITWRVGFESASRMKIPATTPGAAQAEDADHLASQDLRRAPLGEHDQEVQGGPERDQDRDRLGGLRDGEDRRAGHQGETEAHRRLKGRPGDDAQRDQDDLERLHQRQSGCASSSSRKRPSRSMTGAARAADERAATTNTAVMPNASAAGPASAIEAGISASDTKKSRLETRPRSASGTRRWRSVPQITIPTPSVTPTTIAATRQDPQLGGDAEERKGQEPDAPDHEHHRQVAARQRAATRSPSAPIAEPMPKVAEQDPVLGRPAADAAPRSRTV